MEFCERTGKNIGLLTKSELRIYNYILDNMETVYCKSVRALAEECYVSTTTILRLANKIGFDGYNDMTDAIKDNLIVNAIEKSTNKEDQVQFKEEYVHNIVQSIKIIDDDQLLEIVNNIRKADKLYVFSQSVMESYGSYIKFLFEAKGIDTNIASSEYFRKFYSNKITPNDFVIIIDYKHEEENLVNVITKCKLCHCHNILTITQANNEIMQTLSNYNINYFTDHMVENKVDITANISVMAILEIIIHNL